MLKFIDENDFLLVDEYKTNTDGSIAWTYDEGIDAPTHCGVIRDGFIRTKDVQTGTETVVIGQDENGDDITEEQPVYETVEIDVWAKLQALHTDPNSPVTILPIPQSVLDEESLNQFRVTRTQQLANATVETTAGNVYDADEKSQERIARAIKAAELGGYVDTDTLSWSLANTDTGIMTSVPLSDMKEALVLAVQNMANVWGRE